MPRWRRPRRVSFRRPRGRGGVGGGVGWRSGALVAGAGCGRGGFSHRQAGRARDKRLGHVTLAGAEPRPGDVVTTTVTRAAPHYLIADTVPLAVRHTRGGDAWQAWQEGPGKGAAGPARNQVPLGMPAVGAPAS